MSVNPPPLQMSSIVVTMEVRYGLVWWEKYFLLGLRGPAADLERELRGKSLHAQ